MLSNLVSDIEEFLVVDIMDVSDVLLLAVRVILAIIFFTSFRNKSRDIKGFAKSNGLPIPAVYILLAVELSAAVLLSIGLYTQIGATLVMAAMAGSMFFHIAKWKSPYWASQGGWEYDLMIFTLAAVILVFGGGDIALKPLPSSEWLPFIR